MTATIVTPHFSVVEVIQNADASAGRHRRPAPWLTFPISGEVRRMIDGQWRICDSSTAAVFPAQAADAGVPMIKARSIVIHGLSAEAVRAMQALAQRGGFFRGATLRPLFLRVWRELHSRDRAAQLAIDGALFLLLAELSRMSRIAPQSCLASDLEAAFDPKREGDAVAQLAAANDMAARTYKRRFRRETGVSVGKYLSQLRVERAKNLLRSTSLSTLDIARALGYCDRSHFARAFSEAVGLTPSDYRRSIL